MHPFSVDRAPTPQQLFYGLKDGFGGFMDK